MNSRSANSALTCKFLPLAVGSIMNAKWMQRSGVDYGDFCVAQGTS